MGYELRFPEYLTGYEMETEAKGYLVDVRVVRDGAAYGLTIYDPVRLGQEVADDVAGHGFFTAANLLVVPRVTREEVARAVERMARSGFSELTPDPPAS